jgi:mono/diheme cytochrome c family protein
MDMKRPIAVSLLLGMVGVVVITARAATDAARSADPAPATRAVTFTRDVAPIVFNNCVSCHRAGEVAPFALTTYDDVKKHAGQIARVTQSRYMPPWKPEPGYGSFVGEHRLTDDQLKTLAGWAAGDRPEGDPKDLPALPTFAEGWKLGTPDLVITMAKPITIPADGDHGHDMYRGVVIPLNLDDDRFVTAVEFRPGNNKVVHHALFFLDSSGAALKKEQANTDGQPGFPSFGGPGFTPTGGLGGWAPGASPQLLPDGWGRLLRKGSDLVVQFHFHPTGKVETVQSTMGIYFAKERPKRIVAGGNAHNFLINIPAGDANYVVTGQYKVPVDVDLIGITPHAHLICKDMHAKATLPDGTVKELIWIKDWDFNWQGQYRYKEPVRLPAGTVVDMRYVYDNSDKNDRNPNTPPRRVHFGEQTTDEMAFLFLEFSPVKASDWAVLKARRPGVFGGRGLGGQ